MQEFQETLVDETDQGAATYYKTFTQNALSGSLQLALTGSSTLTLWASNSPAAVLATYTAWDDVTLQVLGAASFNATTGMFFFDTMIKAKKFKIKYITTDTTNDTKVYWYRGI